AFYFSRENPGTKVTAVTSVLMDRVLGLFAMTALALMVMLYDIRYIASVSTLMTLFWFVLTLFAVFTISLSLMFSTVVYEKGWLFRIIEQLPLSEKLIK